MVKITRAEVFEFLHVPITDQRAYRFSVPSLPLHDFTGSILHGAELNNRSADKEKDCTSVEIYGQREGTNLNYEEGFGLRRLTWLHEASA